MTSSTVPSDQPESDSFPSDDFHAQLSASFLYNTINGISDPIFVKDRHHRWVLVNDAFCKLMGYPRAQLIGKTDYEFFPQTQASSSWESDEYLFTNRLPTETEERFTDAQGNVGVISICKSWFCDHAANPFIVGTIRDITLKVQANEALERSNALLKAQQEAALDGILVVDENNQVVSYNQQFHQIWQIPESLVQQGDDRKILASAITKPENPEEFLAKVDYLYQHPEIVSRDEIALKDGRTLDRYTTAVRTPDGHYYGRVWYFRDLSERKRAEQALQQSQTQLKQQADNLQQTLTELTQAQTQLIQSEKMSSLGQLVAGVAHEINNPISFIYGNLTHARTYIQNLIRLVQLYQQHYPAPSPALAAEISEIDLEFVLNDLPKLLRSMQTGTDRICEIVRSLRNFSRLDESGLKAVDLHQGIDSTLMILQHRLKATPKRKEIQLVKAYEELPLVECYAGQLNQVFMNILSNAIDALEAALSDPQTQLFVTGQQPTITIRTSIVNSQRVAISIADNGCGIPQSVRQRLFDSFFTTKPVGKGTGLGLSISYQVVTQRHHGSLVCLSEPGQGTEFVIEIPIKHARIS